MKVSDSDRTAALAGLCAGLALAAGHMGLWGVLNKRPRWVSYLIGVGTLGAAYTAWAATTRQSAAARGWWIITGLAGAGDLAAYAVRAWQESEDQAADDQYD